MEKILKMLNYQPANLKAININDPEKTVAQFFVDHPVHITREHLWELYRGWTYHAAEYTDEEHTRTLLFFYTQMINFVNASLICVEKRKKEEQKKLLL